MLSLQRLIDRDGGACHYCGVVTDPIWATSNAPTSATRDHRTPAIRGGGDEPANLVVACRSCNSRKGTRSYLDFLFTEWWRAA